MKRSQIAIRTAAALLPILLGFSAGCSRGSEAAGTKAEVNLDPNLYEADRPELFKIAQVETRHETTTLNTNCVITPDVNRTIHVTSLGGGRVVDLKVRLGEQVKKGQVLLVISSPDLAQAFSDYQKAVADERLSKRGLDRAQILLEKGAIAEKDYQLAVDTEEKAQVDVETTAQHVRVLGGDPAKPSAMLELRAPVSGTIVEQNVAGFEGVKSLDNTPNLFTIADLSTIWNVCDVFENDLGGVQVGDVAQVKLNAYPDHTYSGTVSDISRVLDPNSRAAKVRIVLTNPEGLLRPNMYAVATFKSRKTRPVSVVPSTAVIRLHDKDWIFVKEGPNHFRKIQVAGGNTTADGFLEIRNGPPTGTPIVVNALDFSTAVTEEGK